MKVPTSWLAEWVELPNDLEALTRELDDLGLVVEGVEWIGAGLESIIVARVDEIHAIAGADRIRKVVADAGDGPIEIVCGAMNFVVGDHVPFAAVGVTLPGGMEISQRTMKGVVSNGMLCSARELELGDDHDGLLVLRDLPNVQPGARLTDVLHLPDAVLEIAPEGNRPDAWSVAGMARDVAARLQRPLRRPRLASPDTPSVPTTVTVSNDAPDLCGAFAVAVVTEVTVTASPVWLQRRLLAAGHRPINNVVDASNYVMLELGQPTHPYDARLVAGRHLGVRQARRDETVTLLDGSSHALGVPGAAPGDFGVDCVIIDGSDAAVGLAGVMGGQSTAISATTTELFLEAAFFDPMTIARTSKRLGLRTEASARFERGVDPTLAKTAIARFVAVLQESSQGLRWSGDPVSLAPNVPILPTITLTGDQVSALLGTLVSSADAAALLRAIDFAVMVSGDTMTVTPPAARLDVRAGVAGRADVIEEIARLYSYQRLARRVPSWPAPGGLTDRQRLRRRVREGLVGLGLLEAWTDTFVSDDAFSVTSSSPLRVRVANPLSSEASLLRSSLLTGLATAWGYNVERGEGDLGLFELGSVFEHPGWTSQPRRSRGGVGGADKIELPTERELLLVVLGRTHDDAATAVATWRAIAERLHLAGVVVRQAEAPAGWHPTRAANLVDRATGAVVGQVGEIDPTLIDGFAPSAPDGQRVGLLQVDLTELSEVVRHAAAAPPEAPSRFPSALLDVALVTPDAVNAEDVAEALRNVSALVARVTLFDVFRGPGVDAGSRSLAYGVTLIAPDRTLTEAEIASVRQDLIVAASGLGARLR